MKLIWGGSEHGGHWDPFSDEVTIGKMYIKRGWAPSVIAHELAHRREGILTGLPGDNSAKTFWKELAAWEAAIDRGLPLEELDREMIEDSLGGYLEDVGWEFGKDSGEYKFAVEGYERFKRRYFREEG